MLMEEDRTQMDGFEAAVCADLEKIRTDTSYTFLLRNAQNFLSGAKSP